MDFSHELISWYQRNGRDLPWRQTRDPYAIWVSEIILQQTRVVQGMAYYLRFMERFPDVASLASASEDEVLKMWQGLGYYSRARNMREAARQVVERFGGVFPKEYEEVRSLKGVGDYTAAAICSFAYDLPYPAVDGNAYRLLSRFFRVEEPIDTPQGKRLFTQLSLEVMDKGRPALYNQAVMDLGATICLPASPNCEACPLKEGCALGGMPEAVEYPKKGKKIIARDRYFVYLAVEDGTKTYLRRREGKDIWNGLYEYPMVELPAPLSEHMDNDWMKPLEQDFSDLHVIGGPVMKKHVLTHQNIHAAFFHAEGRFLCRKESAYIEVEKNRLGEYAVSRLMEKFLLSE